MVPKKSDREFFSGSGFAARRLLRSSSGFARLIISGNKASHSVSVTHLARAEDVDLIDFWNQPYGPLSRVCPLALFVEGGTEKERLFPTINAIIAS
jgi:hypothetical protein